MSDQLITTVATYTMHNKCMRQHLSPHWDWNPQSQQSKGRKPAT